MARRSFNPPAAEDQAGASRLFRARGALAGHRRS